MSRALARTEKIVSLESLTLAILCSLDMLTSAYLFQQNLAVEANPLLRPWADAGVGPFLAVKSLTFVPAIAYVEWLRRQRPAFTAGLLRWACGGYLAIYCVPAGWQLLR